MSDPRQHGLARLATLGWSVYLACSWTWCIGMFLPVLLVRDYGLIGFIAFGVPNVIGAGALAWVLRDAAASRRLVERHRFACRAFSAVTILFQGYFAGVVLTAFGPAVDAWLAAGFLGVLLLLVIAAHGGRTNVTALVVFAVSVGVFAALIVRSTGWEPRWKAESADPLGSGLIWLAPVMAFGFVLCPYLDATFHRARQATSPAAGRAAFAIGFAALFPVMILLTYAARDPLSSLGQYAAIGVAIALAVHLLIQLAFTIAAHSATLERRDRRSVGPDSPIRAIVLTMVLVVPVSFVGVAASFVPEMFGLRFTEVGYRVFMAFYGLVFPAYVWLIVIPTRDGHSGTGGDRGRRKRLIWALAVGVAAPMFWKGFIERQETWLGPGLLIVLLARLALPRDQEAGSMDASTSRAV